MRSVVEIGASVPAFLGKLWKLVNDPETNNLISWSPGGKTFMIKNQADFARDLLPHYYKHNNMASFIRQLNMYGFHKITSVENGGLRYEKDEIEFSHPCFMRGHSYLLEHIKRKIANPKAIITSSESGEKIMLKPEMMNKVLADVKQMKGKQESLDAKFGAMKQENEALWREVAILRQKHIKQQQIVNNLIQFLMSLVQPSRAGNSSANGVGVKRPYQLMINSAAHNSKKRAKTIKIDKDSELFEELFEDNMEDGPTIHELVHDDMHNTENSQDASPGFVTIEVSPSPLMSTNHSPLGAGASSLYQVTHEDEEENEIDAAQPTTCATNNSNIRMLAPSPTAVSSASIAQVPLSPVNPLDVVSNISVVPGTQYKSKGKSHVSKSKANMASPSHFNAINTGADLRLPAEIFASDDSVSDAGVGNPEDLSAACVAAASSALADPIISSDMPPTTTKDKMFGGINIKVEKLDNTRNAKTSSKSKETPGNFKIADIKTELQDDIDWNNMSLATLNNNTDVGRFHNVNRRENFNRNLDELSAFVGNNIDKGDIDDHLDTMQTDLESLRELLRSDSYSFDANTLLGLFGSEDPFYGLSYNPTDERTRTPTNNARKQKSELSKANREECRVQDLLGDDDAEGSNQLMSYTGNIPDFGDMSIPELEADNSQDYCISPGVVESSLNTPQVLRSPAPAPLFPKP